MTNEDFADYLKNAFIKAQQNNPQVDYKGTTYVLDSGNHRIIIRDNDNGYLIFGGYGRKHGMFLSPSAISIEDDQLVVEDGEIKKKFSLDERGNPQVKGEENDK